MTGIKAMREKLRSKQNVTQTEAERYKTTQLEKEIRKRLSMSVAIVLISDTLAFKPVWEWGGGGVRIHLPRHRTGAISGLPVYLPHLSPGNNSSTRPQIRTNDWGDSNWGRQNGGLPIKKQEKKT